ncbi:MAG: hypothetical protein KatS3mg131_3942 [Candidatus Tectimicrobiota bacterium]|nr:MAG: hypothetical protein KatS3mg131_3942 [Candidatus Tectomicrobia bacterium]
MNRRMQQVALFIGLALVLALPPLALAQITRVQMGVDGMI